MEQVQINAKEFSFHLLAVEILLTVEKKKETSFLVGRDYVKDSKQS